MKKPVAFMSYAHRDDRSGRLTELREHLSEEVSVQTGEDFEVFQDRDAILWGQNWKERIEDSLNEVTFLIAIITPSFFGSPHCRNELKRFIDREKKLDRNDLILPIYYVDTPLVNDEAKRATDELAQIIATRQYVDWRDLRTEPLTSPQVVRKLGQLGSQIRDALDRVLEAENQHKEVEATVPAPTQVKVFETSEQTAWLKVTEKGLEYHLDNRRPGRRSRRWTLTRTQAKEILSKHDYGVNSRYKPRSGLFSIGFRKGWLYSKRLFPEPSLLEREIQRLLEKAST
jgi:hypothetical protein